MDQFHTAASARDIIDHPIARRRILLGELKRRTLWFVRLRWWVPAAIAAGIAAAWRLGVQFPAAPLLLVALFILVYNSGFFFLSRRLKDAEVDLQETRFEHFAYFQVCFDYLAMFLLIHLTGGVNSPFIFFFIFHIIFASILLPSLSAFGFAIVAALGMIAISSAEYFGIITHYELTFRGAAMAPLQHPFNVMAVLAFFSASVFTTAFFTTAIMRMLRKRILELRQLSETLSGLNGKLSALYNMVGTIGSARKLDHILDTATSELAHVMGVQAISVKLLNDDGRTLSYAASYGLPAEYIKDKEIKVDQSLINRKIIMGEPYVTGSVTRRDMFQFGEDLAAFNIDSVLFVPLNVEKRVIGILGAYCKHPGRFQAEDVEFFRLAAGLTAIAIENARAYESVEKLMDDRSKFMMRMAHNMRAPLAAMLSILETVREGYHGELNDQQKEYLRRVDRRARTMLSMVSELMTLAQNRSVVREIKMRPVDLRMLAHRLQKTFEDEAVERGLHFKMSTPSDLPEGWGDFEMLEQLMENLISNAIKYTTKDGKVDITFSESNKGYIRIEVKDNGIGIPKTDKDRLFHEFFRADNAKAMEEVGTGLGLAIVKEIVDKHQGRVFVESEEGLGTIFLVHIPTRKMMEGTQDGIRSKQEID